MMRRFYIVVLGLIVACCGDSKETRLQRYLLQGNEAVKLHEADQAERYFKEALKLDSCFADSWNNLGSFYFDKKKYEEALDSYKRAIACKPEYLAAYFNRANASYEVKEYYSA